MKGRPDEEGNPGRDPRGLEPPRPIRAASAALSDIPNIVKVRERPLKTRLIGRGGTVLVCPPGWGVPGDLALNLLQGCADLARFLSFDPSGTGESTGLRAKEDLGSRGISNDASGILLRLKLRPIAVFGHSHGGCAALRLSIAHSELVRRLIVVSTTAGDGAPASWDIARVLGASLAAPATREDLLRGLRLLQTRTLADPARAREIFPAFEDARLNVSVERFNGLAKEGRTYDLRTKLRHVQAPALILAGRHDPLLPPSAAETLRAGIPKSELVLFEHSGHFPMLEEPQKFKAVIEEFLKRD